MTPEKKLAGEGWQKQGIYDEHRLSEIIEMYREIGLEVHLEPFNPENEKGCTTCMQQKPDQYKTLYTRKQPDV